MSNSSGQFVWYDLMTPDVDAATRFYSEVIGWGTQAWDGPAPYTMWTANEVPIGGVVPLTSDHAAAGVIPHWMAYITTPDVDATFEKAKTKGAAVVAEPRDIPDVGRLAVIRDPQGALIAIYKPATEVSWSEPAIGQFSWHELSTTDHVAAFDFYGDLFGWEKTGDFDMGGTMGTYQMYGQNGAMYGGMMNKGPDNPMPPAWLLYARVADTNAAIETVKRLGGQVIYGPMEPPGGDIVAAFLDPQGAAFAVHQKKA